MRIIVFPLVIQSQRNAAHMNNVSPAMTALQEKMSEARRRGDVYETQTLSLELQKFMQEKGVNPFKNALPMLFQVPIFLSMFIGLRQMAKLPVPSMETGGALWFTNLSLADPYCALPALTAGTLYLQLYLAAEGPGLQTGGTMMRTFLKVMPIIVFGFTFNFPTVRRKY